MLPEIHFYLLFLMNHLFVFKFQPPVTLGQLLISLLYDCVTDKIFVTIRQFRQLAVSHEDLGMVFH